MDNQTKTVNALKKEGFTVDARTGGAVRVSRGADKRIVQYDGTQKRGWPEFVKKARR